jgi:hypothetical protein
MYVLIIFYVVFFVPYFKETALIPVFECHVLKGMFSPRAYVNTREVQKLQNTLPEF